MIKMIVRDKDNVSVIFVVVGLGNLVRVNINNSPAADCQLEAIVAKPMKPDSIKIQHISRPPIYVARRILFKGDPWD
jgi:hypothetical protein